MKDLYMHIYLKQRYADGKCRQCANPRDSVCVHCAPCREKRCAYYRERGHKRRAA